ncbi:hypothetical protein ACMUMS_15180, partial [Acinetobacter courvalinii]|uniref:hypothetical protein n=1 Tax=Acinetobacter courvalinii TaxID=280147 RepID=UPI003A8A9F96
MSIQLNGLVEHTFNDEEFNNIVVEYKYIEREVAKQKECIQASYKGMRCIIFFRDPELADLAWWSYEITENFKIGKYENLVRIHRLLDEDKNEIRSIQN